MKGKTMCGVMLPNGATKDGDQMLSVPELAMFLNVPESWVYARTADWTIPHVRVGKYVRFRVHEIITWLDAGNAQPR